MSEYRSKSAAIGALLRNKDIARQIFAAMKAPHGSTKNKTAARILRSVGKAADNRFNDGQGGGPVASVFSPAALTKKPVAPAAPVRPGPTMAAAQAAAPKPMAGVPTPDQALMAPPPPTSIARSIDDHVPNLTQSSALTPEQASSAQMAPPAAPTPVPTRPPFDFSLLPKPAYAAEVERNGDFSPGEVDEMFLNCVRSGAGNAGECSTRVKSETGKMVTFNTAYAWAHRDRTKPDKEFTLGPSNVKSVSKETKTTTEGELPGTPGSSSSIDTHTDEAGDIFHSYGTTDVQRMLEEAKVGGDDAIDAWFAEFQKRDPSGAAAFQPIYNAYKSGTGAAGATLGIVTDPAQLEATLGIPKEVLDKMPWDILGGPKLAELTALARKTYGLDQLEAELQNRTTDHLYAEENFKNFVLGKDEYLRKVDTMLHEYDQYLQTADQSDPRIRNRMKNYRNYLVTQKGAIQQKYINLINMSVKQESADYQRFENIYKSKQREADSLEKALTASATTSWQKTVPLITDSIKSMYQSLEKQKTANQEQFKAEVERVSAANKMLSDIEMNDLKADKLRADINKTTNSSTTDKIDPTTGKKYKTLSETKAKTEFYSTPPTSNDPGKIKVMTPTELNEVATRNGADPLQVTKDYLAKLQGSLITEAATGTFTSMKSAISALASLDQTDPKSKEIYDTYMKTVLATVPKGVTEYLSSGSENTAFIKAMEQLKKGKMWLGFKDLTRKEFISDNDSKMTKEVAALLWDVSEFGGGNANGAPFGYSAQEWDSMIANGASALLDDLQFGIAEFIQKNPTYSFS